ncbi:hypothetical protein ACFYNN_28965 [Streptomyces sp. NPDC006978]|nr:hypothetical protein [Streptomyces sp. S584]
MVIAVSPPYQGANLPIVIAFNGFSQLVIDFAYRHQPILWTTLN